MKCIRLFYLFFILSSVCGFSQETFTRHTVEKGETISEIAKKYHVEPKAIYELNPDASKGIKCKSVLIIPKTSSLGEKYAENKNQKSGLTHKVLNKETLFSIAKKYKVKVQDLYVLNPNLEKEGLKNGQIINITKSNVSDILNENAIETDGIAYEVLPKATKYSIAKTYGISVERLEKANPILQTEELKVGQKIIIPVKSYNPSIAVVEPAKGVIEVAETSKIVSNVEVKKPEIEKPTEKVVAQKTTAVVENVKKETEKATSVEEGIEYEVLPKATKYSIAKAYGISVDRLERANPILQTEELKIGQKIIIPVNPYNPNDNVAETTKAEITVAETSVSVSIEKAIKKKEEKVLSQNGQSNVDVKTSVVYVVLPKESLYSIAQKNEITVSDLKKANPILEKYSLKSGQKITIPVKNKINSNAVTSDNAKIIEKEVVVSPSLDVENKTTETDFNHEVLQKETKYGIAKEYGISIKELEKQNPNIIKRLSVGTMLKIHGKKVIEQDVPKENVVVDKPIIEVNNTKLVNDSLFVDQLIQTASENIGTRYRSGGTSKEGFDCSGLMCTTFGAFDINLPRTSIEQSQYGVVVSKEEAQKGDLIFFKTNSRRQINHVGMVVEVADGDIKFIHASVSGGVMISSINEKYYIKRFSQINRVLN
jgi:LysM repeat protein